MVKAHFFKIAGEIFLCIVGGVFIGYAVANTNDACVPLDICHSTKSYFLMSGFVCVFGSALGIFKAICTDFFKLKESSLFKYTVYSHSIMGIVGWLVLMISFVVIINSKSIG